MGFVINPYDRCVANAIINGKQCTIFSYVDDNKISHVDKQVVDDILRKIGEQFGELTISRGNSHSFLGLNFTIKDKKIHIEMRDQLQEAIDMIGEELDRDASTSAAHSLQPSRHQTLAASTSSPSPFEC